MSRQKLAGLTIVVLCATLSVPPATAGASPVAGSGGPANGDSGLVLWYDEPAPDSYNGWGTRSLPIGNGALGATVFGGVQNERLQFNDKSLWTGGPGVPSGSDPLSLAAVDVVARRAVIGPPPAGVARRTGAAIP